jgi:hypothetical protein
VLRLTRILPIHCRYAALSSNVLPPVPPALLNCRVPGVAESITSTSVILPSSPHSSCLSSTVFSVRLSILSITLSSLGSDIVTFPRPVRSAAMFIEEGIDNHYQDIEKIGEGGFGTVFRAVSRLNGEVSPPPTHHD